MLWALPIIQANKIFVKKTNWAKQAYMEVFIKTSKLKRVKAHSKFF